MVMHQSVPLVEGCWGALDSFGHSVIASQSFSVSLGLVDTIYSETLLTLSRPLDSPSSGRTSIRHPLLYKAFYDFDLVLRFLTFW